MAGGEGQRPDTPCAPLKKKATSTSPVNVDRERIEDDLREKRERKKNMAKRKESRVYECEETKKCKTKSKIGIIKRKNTGT